MIAILPVILRVLFAAALITGIAGSMTARIPPIWRKSGYAVAIGAAVALVVVRIVLRLTVPEEVPSFGG